MYRPDRRGNPEPIKSIDFFCSFASRLKDGHDLSHPSQDMTEYEMNKGVCEGYKNKSDREKYD